MGTYKRKVLGNDTFTKCDALRYFLSYFLFLRNCRLWFLHYTQNSLVVRDLQVETTALCHPCGKLHDGGRGKSAEPSSCVFACFWQVCRKLFFPVPQLPSLQLTSPKEAHGICPTQSQKLKGKDSPGRFIPLVCVR